MMKDQDVILNQQISAALTEEASVHPLEICIKLFVLIVEKNVKCHLSHQKTDQSTAETVMESTKNSKFIFFDSFLDTIFFIFF